MTTEKLNIILVNKFINRNGVLICELGGEVMSVKSAERVMDVIDYLVNAEEPATLMELSECLGIPKSSMSQLLSTMMRKQYLTKDQANRYKLGHKLITAGNRARVSNDIYSVSIPVLKQTIQRTGETLFLGIRSGKEVIYLAKVDSDQSMRTAAQPGSRKPLYCTGLGKTFLAFENRETSDRLIEEIEMKRHTRNTITDPDELKRAAESYRNEGFVIDDEEGEQGIYCIAAPIFDESGKIIAALSCAGGKDRILEKHQLVIDEITDAAKRISITQGYLGGA
ncbi:IclR family transcriptional regulator [Bhargavaea changchunensis]|uniref:IclR family transcriptional regulator n=1 Tax=Bhargavaea changchunensis TaxID=2134037 RepID=A0ABW2NI93_9BACL